jgi:7-dehydrocholesterol reductase
MESALFGESPQKLFGILKFLNIDTLICYLEIWQYISFVSASYIDDFGKNKKSILLASGFWAITRHMNYTFELMSALVWSLPALIASPIPYFYFIFLLILLTHRTVRDDNKCSKKYGIYWREYRKIVKYQMIPGIYWT